MAEHSAISWTDATFNPWRGCSKVSQGCANCYAETLSHRNPEVLGAWGSRGSRPVAAESYWRQPLRWDAKAAKAGRRTSVFCASLADVFEADDTLPPDVVRRGDLRYARVRLFALIEQTAWLDWLLLTKRTEAVLPILKQVRADTETFPERAGDWPVLALKMLDDWLHGQPPGNVRLGASVEDQPNADRRIPELLAVPAAVRWLSVEPQLGYVNIMRPLIGYKLDHCRPTGFRPEDFPAAPKIHWVITGGESGSGARPYDLAWPRYLRDQCKAAGIAFFMKQMGADPVRSADCGDVPDDVLHPGMFVNDERNLIQLRLKDRRAGADPAEWPADLRIQEFPA